MWQCHPNNRTGGPQGGGRCVFTRRVHEATMTINALSSRSQLSVMTRTTSRPFNEGQQQTTRLAHGHPSAALKKVRSRVIRELVIIADPTARLQATSGLAFPWLSRIDADKESSSVLGASCAKRSGKGDDRNDGQVERSRKHYSRYASSLQDQQLESSSS